MNKISLTILTYQLLIITLPTQVLKVEESVDFPRMEDGWLKIHHLKNCNTGIN